ncbi:HD family phosphohydrolase [Leptolyngbya ohadii]|uniref:HD family phosphohydrolase n=1 Tax=Leptolyngbya ohadii TaxID=1962290 RepID=UPI0019D48DCC|nr:HDIG domain-containing metalloprotein [Leptolyngbya ohadii]
MKLEGRRSKLAKRFYRIGILVAVLLLLTSGLGYRFYRQPKLVVGKVAPQTIVAPAAATVEDVEVTQEKRREVRRGILPAVSVDPDITQQIQQGLQQQLEQGTQIRQALGSFPYTKTSALSTPVQIYLRQATEQEWQTIQQSIGQAGQGRSFNAQSSLSRPETMQQQAIRELQRYRQFAASQAFSQLLDSIREARRRYPAALLMLTASSSPEDRFRDDPSFLNLSDSDWQQARIEIEQTAARILIQGIYPGLSESQFQQAIASQVQASVPIAAQPLAAQLLSTALSPNVVKDPERTRERIEQAVQAIEPALITVNRGEVIVRAGEEITPADFALLDHLDLSQRRIDWLGLLGFSGLVGLAIYGFRRGERWLKPKLRYQDYCLIIGLTLSAPLVIALTQSFTALPAIGLLLGSFYGSGIGGIVMGLLPVLLSIGTEANWNYLVPSAAGGLLGSLMAGQWRLRHGGSSRTREDLAVLGVLIGLTSGIVYLLINAPIAPLWSDALRGAAMSALTGIGWSIVAIGVSPYLERFFDLVTPIRLAELANPNRPLLKRLAQEAPGTFQHTQFVATLAETAARQLGCNAELVRTGTLYHDVGKLHDPLAFIENQMGGLNKHNDINDPWKSADIIKKHVSEGLTIARQYKLPSAVQAFIPEHQGTILIAYFYHQAQQQSQQSSRHILHELDFRYDGPVPQSRETGIVMLADACEAALRSLGDATPSEALAMVNKIFRARWQDQQLVDSGLTQQDLSQISHIFVQVWQQFHHKRIVYPK